METLKGRSTFSVARKFSNQFSDDLKCGYKKQEILPN